MPTARSDDEFSVVLRLGSGVEADLFKQVLYAEAIPFVERPYRDTAFDGPADRSC